MQATADPIVVNDNFLIPRIAVPEYLITTNIHPGEHWPFTYAILESVLLGGRLAVDTFYAWLKVAYEAGYYYEPAFGQVVFIFGPNLHSGRSYSSSDRSRMVRH